MVELDLPLAQPDTPRLSERVEAAGFFFAGVWPHAAGDGDVLHLARLASPLDMGQLRFDGDFAQALARYVDGQRLRTSREHAERPRRCRGLSVILCREIGRGR